MGSDLLSRLITREEQLGNIKGINISKNGHYLTHILFVDNLIIFSTTSVLNAKSLLNYLDKYSSWSGQEIMNFKAFLARIKYLGLPLSFDRPNSRHFNEILDKMQWNPNFYPKQEEQLWLDQ